MRIVLSARGSRGDVYPIIAVSQAFQSRGHDITVCVPAEFEQAARDRGLRPVLYPEDSRELMNGFGSGWTALKEALAWFSRSVDEQFRVLVPLCEKADLLVTGTNEIAASSVAEYYGVPFYRITFAPMMAGYQSNSLLPWQGLPKVVNRAAWQAINGVVELLAKRPINRNRVGLSMPAIRGIGQHVARFGHTLFAMNTTLAPPCASWGRNNDFTYTGYCHEKSGGELSEPLERFILSGSTPVYIGFGSVSVEESRRFSQIVRDAALRSGVRVVLGAGWTGLGREIESSDVHVIGDVPHDTLFPRMAAVLHHGGSGTTHTAARAGVPQLVMPQIADQHYWGHRVAALGCGPAPISPSRMNARRLARALRALTAKPRYARHAAALGQTMRTEDGVSVIVGVVEVLEKIENLVDFAGQSRWVSSSHR